MDFHYSNKVLGMRPSIIRELLKQMSDPSLISFAGGNPAADSFPVADIRAFSDKLLETDPVGMLQYSVTEGYGPLREACRDFANRKWPVVKKSDEVIITSGSQQVIEFMAKLLCNEGDVVAVEEPAFLGAYNSMRSFGAELRGVPLEPDGVDLEALEAPFAAQPKPKFFYCIPNFQNPTGYTTSEEKRKAIYRLAVQYGVPVLEDDPYGALRICGEDVPPIKHFDECGAVVYAGSFSKILCPGMRLAYCAGQGDLIAKMVTAKQGSDVHTNVWAQRVCERMLTQADMDAHIARLQAIYREKANHMMARLDGLGGAVSYVRPEGGMFIWAKLPDEVPVGEFARRCLEKKLAVVPGSAFYTDSAVEQPFVRLNFSTPTKEQIDRGVAVMAEVLAEMTKPL